MICENCAYRLFPIGTCSNEHPGCIEAHPIIGYNGNFNCNKFNSR